MVEKLKGGSETKGPTDWRQQRRAPPPGNHGVQILKMTPETVEFEFLQLESKLTALHNARFTRVPLH